MVRTVVLMVRTNILALLLLSGCTTISTDTPKFGNQVEAPYGWQYTYCPTHKDDVGCKEL